MTKTWKFNLFIRTFIIFLLLTAVISKRDGKSISFHFPFFILISGKNKNKKNDDDQQSSATITPFAYTCDSQGPFPYMVSVRDVNNNHICGGVIVAPNKVLTAAECITTLPNASRYPNLYLGGIFIDTPVEIKSTIEISFAPGYDQNNPRAPGNLALLKLNEPTCLKPIPYIGGNFKDYNPVTILGFGSDGITPNFSPTLLFASFRIFDNEECESTYGNGQKIYSEHFCGKNIECDCVSVCRGDKGDPLFYRPSDAVFEDVLIGIVSHTTSFNCKDVNGASVFSNIMIYKPWVDMTFA